MGAMGLESVGDQRNGAELAVDENAHSKNGPFAERAQKDMAIDAILLGESLMREPDIGAAIDALLDRHAYSTSRNPRFPVEARNERAATRRGNSS